MSSNNPEYEVDELELGPLRQRFLPLSARNCCSGTGEPIAIMDIAFGIGLIFFGGCIIGMIVSAGFLELGIISKGPAVFLVALNIAVAAALYQTWWVFFMPRRSYLAVHETGIAYRCNSKQGRIRFAELRDAFSMTERSKPMFGGATLANSKLIRFHLTLVSNDGEAKKIPHLIAHLGNQQTNAFFDLVKQWKNSEQALVEKPVEENL